MFKKFFWQFILVSFSFAMILVMSEIAFRYVIFSKAPLPERFRDPGNYFNYFEEPEYWKLNYYFGEKVGKAPRYGIDSELGWRDEEVEPNFKHHDFEEIKGRRPILMYGDSFGNCVTPTCFQYAFNSNPTFSKKCYMLNYSTGGYGLDQIYMTLQRSVGHYDNPFIVFSLLTLDLDRAIWPVFVGQKPYFKIDNSRLILSGLPIEKSPADYFSSFPFYWGSYLLQYFRSFQVGYSPYKVTNEHKERVREMAEHLIKNSILEMRKQRLDFIFLIFQPDNFGESGIRLSEEQDWRLKVIADTLKSMNAPFITTQSIVGEYYGTDSFNTKDLFIAGDGHPTHLQNQLIYEGLNRQIFIKKDGVCN